MDEKSPAQWIAQVRDEPEQEPATGETTVVVEATKSQKEKTQPTELAAVLSTLKDKLTDVSKKNRSVRLLRLNLKLHFDLAELMEDPEKETGPLLEKIRKQKTLRLAAVLSKEEEELKSGYRLTHIQREADFIQKETGNYDVYIGYPFAEGRFKDGTYFKSPLVLFPVTLEKDFRRLEFTAKPDADRMPIINRAFLVAYQKFNGVLLHTDVSEVLDGEGSIIDQALERYRQLGITFEGEAGLKADKLTKFRPMSADAAPRELAGRMRIVRNAVLGLFPQTSSTLVSDYDALRRNPPTKGLLADFFGNEMQTELPPFQPQADLAIVTDVDSSQERVISASRTAPGIAVYGPPGTGKSQVIVNLIADTVAQGKTALIVCEKRAALDVVYNRLRGIGLSDLAIVVHDYEKDRNAVYEKTGRVLTEFMNPPRGSAPAAPGEDPMKFLAPLTAYHQALHKPLPCGATLHELYAADPASASKLLDLGGLEKKFDFAGVRALRKKLDDIVPLAVSADTPFHERSDFSRLNADQWYQLQQAGDVLSKTDAAMNRIFNSPAWKKLQFTKDQLYPASEELEKQLRTLAQGSLLRMADVRLWKARSWLEHLQKENRETDAEHKKIIQAFIRGKPEGENRTTALLSALFEYNKCVQEAKTAVQTVRTFLGPQAVLGVVPKASRGETASAEIRELRQTLSSKDTLARRDSWIQELSPNEHAALQIVLREVDTAKEIAPTLDRLEHTFYYHWIAAAETENPDVTRMDPETYAKKRREAIRAFDERKKHARNLVRKRWRQGLTEIAHSDLKYIKFQAEKPAHRWPLRRYASEFHQRGLLKVFPVWLASPQTVSALFPLTQGLFDLVVFDEASQCPLEHAIPALHRAKSAVVAGDEKQLPPFDLFESYLDEADENLERSQALTDATETESFLQLAKKRYPELLLQWHYRSKHNALIAFSNHAFYGGRMAFVPDAQEHDPQPIEWVSVPGVWEHRHNRVEAEKIVAMIEKLISKNRPPSIGVITFNSEQRELIENLLERKARKDPQFYVKYRREKERMQDEEVQGLFVKNIENVQGDERDVILFSIGYAPNEAGNVVAQFGSLGIPGGENRLNVAISRARDKIYVVSSISPLDLHTDDSENHGPRLLKKYLEYAQFVSQGSLTPAWLAHLSKEQTGESGFADGFETEATPLARRVAQALEKQGFTVRAGEAAPQALELAVVSKKNGGKFLVGIECDGRPYANVQQAKEFDVYRSLFLLKRGWNIYRVSSRKWWQDPQRVVGDIAALAKAAEGKN